MGKDINTPLRKAYVDLIEGLTYNGSSVAAYDGMAPDSASMNKTEFLFCEVKDQTMNDSVRTKSELSYSATIMVNIYNGYLGGGGRKKVDDIAAMIFNTVLTVSGNGINLSGSNLKVVTTSVAMDVSNTFSTKSHKVWVRSIRFRHHIQEL